MPVSETSMIRNCLFLGLVLILAACGATAAVAAPAQQISALTRSANSGDAEAQYKLALLYEEGQGVKKDFGKALNWYHLAAKQGHVEAQFKFASALNEDHPEANFLMGEMYRTGDGVPKNTDEAINRYKLAATAGHRQARSILNKTYNIKVKATERTEAKNDLANDASAPDRKKIKSLIKSAEAGDPDSQYELALLYEEGKGVQQNTVKAFEWYRRAASSGQVDAQYKFATALEKEQPDAIFIMGMMYMDGEGVDKNIPEAIKRFKSAADKGHAEAQFMLGSMYAEGDGVARSDSEAKKWWQMAAVQGHKEARANLATIGTVKSAEAGDISSQYSLAKMYEGGKGFKKDTAKAFGWYSKAAGQGHLESQIKVAAALAKGKGTKKSASQSMVWYEKAAEQGDLEAQFLVGLSYENGAGVTRDYRTAAKWYARAAGKGSVSAQYRLGLLSCFGKGIGKSYANAIKWWDAAANKGDHMAIFFLGYMYETGSGVKRNRSKAKNYYKRASQKGNIFAKQALEELK